MISKNNNVFNFCWIKIIKHTKTHFTWNMHDILHTLRSQTFIYFQEMRLFVCVCVFMCMVFLGHMISSQSSWPLSGLIWHLLLNVICNYGLWKEATAQSRLLCTHTSAHLLKSHSVCGTFNNLNNTNHITPLIKPFY